MSVLQVQNNKPVNLQNANYKSDTQIKEEIKKTKTEKVDKFEKEDKNLENLTYQPAKKLTTEQLDEINKLREESKLRMVEELIGQNLKIQGREAFVMHAGFEFKSSSVDLLVGIFGSLENALPTPATTQEGALKNISEGGSYSVEAVSERIMLMATSIAGGDTEVLNQMKEAVIKGFEAAGFDAKTGGGMPQITTDTYNHIMGEFSKLLDE